MRSLLAETNVVVYHIKLPHEVTIVMGAILLITLIILLVYRLRRPPPPRAGTGLPPTIQKD